MKRKREQMGKLLGRGVFVSGLRFALLPIILQLLSACSSTSGPENRPPETPSAPAGPPLAVINQPVTYTAGAIDPDNNLSTLTFFWDGQDTSVVSLAPGSSRASASHSYTKLGSFQIFVVATDIAGLRSDSSDGLRVTVVEPGPLPPSRPTGVDTTFVTQQYTFSSSALIPEGDSLFLTFTWGDGDSTASGWDTSGAQFTVSHIYYDTGSFVIRVTATDDSGCVSSPSLGKTVVALNRAPLKPSAPFGPASSIVGEEVRFRSLTADPEGDLFSMTFAWGDGFNSKTALATGDREYSATHAYIDTGMFAVRVSATDVFGNVSDTSTITMIHIPIFPSDTIQFINSALDKKLVTISPSWGVTWINRDNVIFHTIVSDSLDIFGQPIFSTRKLKTDDTEKLTFETPGLFKYHCDDHPLDSAEMGSVRVR